MHFTVGDIYDEMKMKVKTEWDNFSYLLNLNLDFLNRNIILNRAQHIDSLNILIPLTYKHGDYGKNEIGEKGVIRKNYVIVENKFFD